MRKPVIVIFIFLLLEAVSGCTSPVRRQLDRAEAVMESAPDSALAILDSIDTATLTRASDRALYALLLTQGRIKTYEVLTDDSLISTAVSHYEDHGSDSNLMKSLFYQGEIRHNIQDYPSAIIPAMRAREIAVNANDIYWQAKAAELLSFILQSSYNYEEAIKYSKEAVKYYNLIHKEINHRYSLCDLGINYYNTQDYVKSKQILDSLYGLTLEADSFLHAYVLSALYPVYFYSGDKGRAFEFMDELKQYRKHYNWNIKDYARFVQLEIGFKDFSSYNDFVASIDPANLDNPEKAIYYQTKEKYYDEIGDFRRSAMMKDSVKQISDREIENILRQPVLASQRNFYKDRVLLEREHNDKLQKQIIIIAVVSVIVVLVLILIWQIRSRIKNIEIERRIGDIMDLSKELTRYSLKYDAIKTRLSEREHDILDLNDKIEDQFKGRSLMEEAIVCYLKNSFSTINTLCNEYFERGNSEKASKQIINKIESEVSKFCSEDNFRNIENSLDVFRNNLAKRIKSEFFFVSKDEYRIIVLILSGISSKAICLFLNIGLSTFYSKKSRLIKKIQESDSNIKDEIIDQLRER